MKYENTKSDIYSTKGQKPRGIRGINVVDPLVTSLRAMSQQQPLSASSTSSTDEIHASLIRRSWHAMSEILSPFSPGALAQLPKKPRRPSRYTRADAIPDVEPTEEGGQMPTVRDYHSITVPPQVRVPKKTPTPVRVEGKVWFANERSAYLSLSLSFVSSFRSLVSLWDHQFLLSLATFSFRLGSDF